MEGYFKVHRKILDSQVFAHQTALKIWIWCLSKVTYKERFVPLKVGKGFITVKLNPGQFLFGRFKAEEELNIDGSTIYKWIQKFASDEFDMIKIESNNQYSIITICKWEEYQNGSDIEEQPSNNQVTAKEQPCNTNNKDNKDNKDNNKIYSPEIINLYNEVVLFFDENCHPKTEAQKNTWFESIDKLIRIDHQSPEKIIQIVKQARRDDFWKRNFLSILKLRQKNKEGISYFTVFENKFKISNSGPRLVR